MTQASGNAEQALAAISDSLKALGRDVKDASDELRLYMADQLVKLAAVTGQPNYPELLQTVGDNVAERTAIELIGVADAADLQFVNVIIGVISYGARALAGA